MLCKKYRVNRFAILLAGSFFCSVLLQAQCPEGQLLWKRLIYLRDSSAPSPAHLKELLDYEAAMDRCNSRDDSVRSFLLQRIGASYYTQSDFVDAERYTKRALDLISKNYGNPNFNYLHSIKNYYALSLIYDSLGNRIERNKAIDSCIAIMIRSKVVERYSLHLLYKRVQYLYNIGEYQRSYNYAELGEFATKMYSGEYRADYEITFWNLKVNALLLLKKNDAVREMLQHKIDEIKLGSPGSLPTIYQQIGKFKLKAGDIDSALYYYNKALQVAQKQEDNMSCAQALNNIGYEIYFLNKHDYRQALSNYTKAIRYIRRYKKGDDAPTSDMLNAYANIANVYARRNNYDSATFYFQLAFDQINPGLNETTILHSSLNNILLADNDLDYVVSLVLDKGDAYLFWYKNFHEKKFIDEALRIYRSADHLLEKIKNEQSETRSKLLWRSNSRRLYEHAIEASALTNNIPEAFYFFEKSRAVLLNDQLNEHKNVAERDIMRQAQLNKNIIQQERKLSQEAPGSVSYTALQSQLMLDKQELDRTRNQIKLSNPLYYQSFFDSSFITLKDVSEKILNDHEALVEMFAGDSNVYAIIISKEYSLITTINKAKYDSLVTAYNRFISSGDLLNKNYPAFKKVSHQLYQLIFSNRELKPGRIIISPDGNYFPFESLVKSINSNKNDYFVSDYAVTYTYSARYLLTQFIYENTSASFDFMGMAPVRYPSTSIPSLAGSERSLQQIEKYFGDPKILINQSATKNSFLQDFYRSRVMQLYTHATDSGSTGEPTIYFYDSVLYLSDLMPERKPLTELIVLSACETGLGKEYKGEGVFSFNRGFAALGIPSCVMNLWSVDDESTYQLTELFYKHLTKGIPADVALQKARVELLSSSKKSELPYYWAGTVLMGKAPTLTSSSSFAWWLLLIIPFLSYAVWKFRLFVPQRSKEERRNTEKKTYPEV
jgi:CHAT domain-containing protein